MIGRGLLGALALLLLAVGPAAACGQESDCVLGERFYRIYLPDGFDEGAPRGAIVFAHGYRGSAAGVMGNQSLTGLADRLGVALIAVKSASEDWNIPGVPSHSKMPDSDALAYFDAVLADATARFAIDPERIVMTGFSAGGMMVWNLICHRSESFAGFVPIAGTFWRPMPERCETPPANVIHLHGDSDRIVPLAGRKVADAHQGDVGQVLEMYGLYGGYGPPLVRRDGALTCQERRNPDGKILDFCLFPGGHGFKAAYIQQAWERLEAALTQQD